jgi:tRNA(Ile)-lysidine synthase TilS/MesJ
VCGGTRRANREISAIVGDHRLIEEGEQEAAIVAFLIAHEGHTQEVEVPRGTWTIYCRCTSCDDVRTYEVDNEARERALGLPPWPEDMQKRGQDNPC